MLKGASQSGESDRPKVPAQKHRRVHFTVSACPADKGSSRSGRVLNKESARVELLISQAEIALAVQTLSTYRRWFSCWRGRGVGVNDLLNMTWIWHQRTSA